MKNRIMTLPDGSDREVRDADAGWTFLENQPSEFWTDSVALGTSNSDDGWLLVYRHREHGWLVSCCGLDDPFEYFLSDAAKPHDARVRIQKGGAEDEYPVNLFVAAEAAGAAVRTFIRSIRRNDDGHWIAVDQAL